MSCFHLSNGAFGNRNGSWVLSLVGLVEEHLLSGGGSAKGFCTGDLGRPSTFKVCHTDNFCIRVVGLGEVRQARVGKTVRVTVNLPNFDITPDQIIEWMSKFGKVKEGHRYNVVL
jgi:hypothetical protein